MIKCLYQRVKKKNKEIYYYCTKKRENVSKTCYIGCLDKEYKTYKRINKKSKHKEEVSKETYNKVFLRDKGKCRLCGTNKELHLHHILGRGKGKTDNPDNCIMLCNNCHLNIVHKNNKKYRPILWEMINK